MHDLIMLYYDALL